MATRSVRTKKEPPQCGHVVLDASRAELEFLEQVGLVASQIIRTELNRRLVEVLGEPVSTKAKRITPSRRNRQMQIATTSSSSIIFYEDGVTVVITSCDSHPITRAQNYSSANTVATAAPAAFVLTASLHQATPGARRRRGRVRFVYKGVLIKVVRRKPQAPRSRHNPGTGMWMTETSIWTLR